MLRKMVQSIRDRSILWKIPKRVHLLKTYGRNIFCIKNKNIKELQIEDDTYRYLTRKYSKFIDSYQTNDNPMNINKTVWICWMQGLEAAPELIKACVKSVEQHLTDFNIVILTEKNIDQYVDLPGYINKKYIQGKISRTHYSDILRVAVLCDYGGLWLDATVLCTDGKFAEHIINLPIFAYKVMNLDINDKEPIVASSWLISSQSNNPIMLLTRDLLFEYWKENNYLKHFFLVHLFFSMATRKFQSDWDKVPMFNNRTPHTLMFELGDKYNDDRWFEIIQMSSFHKLTRHITYDYNDDNFYNFIINSKQKGESLQNCKGIIKKN